MRVPRPIREFSEWLRYDLPRAIRKRLPKRVDRRTLVAALLGSAVIALLWALATGPLSSDDDPEVETKVVTVAVETDDAAEAPVGPLGFPVVATRNTTRVGGPDPASDAAAVALATHPKTSTADPVEAAVIVESGSPYPGIAASVLAGPPTYAPILIGDPGAVPEPTADALAKLDPRGGSGPADAAVYRVGDVAAPADLQSEEVGKGSPAEIANAVDELRTRLLKAEPQHIVIASSDDPAYAMPAAAWAARSGDPVLFSGREEVPDATVRALERHRGVPIYVLGPPSAISDQAMREIQRITPTVERVGAEGAVANAIAFARCGPDHPEAACGDATFGWNINDSGHGLVLANASRPLDAAAAASLAASGTWGPLLLVETAGVLPEELRSFVLDIKPGFQDDPTRAVYNHIWLIGDTSAIGARVQAELDELAELAEVGPGAGGPVGETQSGSAVPGFDSSSAPDAEPEPEPQSPAQKKRKP